MNITESLNWRYAVKQFDSQKKISDEDWNTLSESLRLAPSSFGLQPWKFFVVQDPKRRETLKAMSWNQSQVTDCSHYVVFCTLNQITEEYIQKYVELIAKTRNVEVSTLDGYKEMMINFLIKSKDFDALAWTRRQSYIAMGQLMTTAAFMKIDSCPIEGISPEDYDKHLDLSDSLYQTVATVALGYRHPDDKLQRAQKVRFAAEDVFTNL